jgi:hypothetical protein
MLQVTKLTVRSFDLDHLDIFWEISPVAGPSVDGAQHEIFNYQFFILRSEAAMGPYDVIGGPYRDSYMFRDNQVSLLSNLRQYFYKVRVQNVVTSEVQDFGPSSNDGAEIDRIASAIMYEEDVLFREFIGRKCYIFPARTFGAACTCFDPFMGRKNRANHGPCFGTGWLGGYLYPVECFVQIDASPRNVQLSSLGETQTKVTTARMMAFPPIKPRDILVESDNSRWRVEQVTPTQRLRAVVHQELVLHKIPQGDIEYNLPINVDVKKLQPAAARNFTNPQNLESSSEDYSDIFAVYGGKPRGSL